MPSTYSNLKIQLMATGENATTWGNVTNVNLGTALEEAIAASADVTFASNNQTLTLTDTNATQVARHLRLRCTGTTGGSTRNLVVPDIEKPYLVQNDCADSIVVKTSAGTGITIPAGKTMWVYADGTNVVDAVTHLTSVTLGTALAVASGGTGANSATGARTNLGLGSIATQNSNSVTITGGSISGITDLAVADGGTGASDASGARTNLGLGSMATQNANSVTITGGTLAGITSANITSANITGGSISGITDLAVADGGTGASNASGARTNLGLGSMATQNANSVTITGGSISGITDLAVADGGTGASDASGARTNLGLGSIATQNSNSVTITGGSISGITDLAVADGGTGASDASGARTNLGATTVGGNFFTLTNPSAIRFIRINADNTVSALSDADFRTAIGAGTGTGTVTSVALSGGTTGLTVSGSPITTSGTITLAGTLAIANGGTGATSATDARSNLGLGSMATQNSSSVTITGGSVSGITDLAVADGGTGASDAAGARTNLGAAASGANTDITALDQDVTVTASGTIAANSIGYRGVPQESKTSGYTLALADAGKHISITTGGVTIPANSSVAFPVGTTIVVYNNSSSTQTIAITTDTLRLAGTATTGTRTLAQRGLATLVKVASTEWVATGNLT